MAAGDELVDLIDEDGRTVGTTTRREMRGKRLLHRCAYVLVFNRRGELFLHLRTATKDTHPSHWDVCVGGVPAAGEPYDAAGAREVAEELGIEAKPERLFLIHHTSPDHQVQGMVYRLDHDGPFSLQAEEIVRGEFVPLEEAVARTQRDPFCPDGVAVLNEYRRRLPRTKLRVLLGSGGFRTPDRVTFLAGQMHSFFGDIGRLLFVPYALQDHDGYVNSLTEKGINAGYELDGIHRHADPREAVRRAEGVFVGGGNTFRLLAELYRHGLLEVLRERAMGGMPYLGVSAGSNVACPTMKTTNDMPITLPPSPDALGLVPFQINPHYFTGQTWVKQGEEMVEHFGETRDDRIREFHEMNDTPVIGLWEAGILRLERGRVTLHGTSARLFRKGRLPVDVPAGTCIDDVLPSGG
jgi:dipeptidase E